MVDASIQVEHGHLAEPAFALAAVAEHVDARPF